MIEKPFKLGVDRLSKSRVLKSADDIEQHVGKCINREAKFSSINIENLAVLVEFARRISTVMADDEPTKDEQLDELAYDLLDAPEPDTDVYKPSTEGTNA